MTLEKIKGYTKRDFVMSSFLAVIFLFIIVLSPLFLWDVDRTIYTEPSFWIQNGIMLIFSFTMRRSMAEDRLRRLQAVEPQYNKNQTKILKIKDLVEIDGHSSELEKFIEVVNTRDKLQYYGIILDKLMSKKKRWLVFKLPEGYDKKILDEKARVAKLLSSLSKAREITEEHMTAINELGKNYSKINLPKATIASIFSGLEQDLASGSKYTFNKTKSIRKHNGFSNVLTMVMVLTVNALTFGYGGFTPEAAYLAAVRTTAVISGAIVGFRNAGDVFEEALLTSENRVSLLTEFASPLYKNLEVNKNGKTN